MHGQKLLDRFARDGALRMAFGIAQHVEHHHAVRHRRKNRAEPVLAVELLADPRDRAIDRALPHAFRKVRFRSRAKHCRQRGRTRTRTPSAAAPSAPARVSAADRGRARRCARPSDCAPRVLHHQHQQGDDDGAAPVRNLVEVEWKPSRQQHDLDRHHRHGAPRNESEQSQHQPREDICAAGSAVRPHRLRARGACDRPSISSPIILSAK